MFDDFIYSLLLSYEIDIFIIYRRLSSLSNIKNNFLCVFIIIKKSKRVI